MAHKYLKIKSGINFSQMSVLDLKLVQRQKLVVNLRHRGIGVNPVILYFVRGYYFTVLFR